MFFASYFSFCLNTKTAAFPWVNSVWCIYSIYTHPSTHLTITWKNLIFYGKKPVHTHLHWRRKKVRKKTGRTRKAMKWKSIKQIELIPVVVRCCKWDTLVAFLSVVFTLCRLINTIHPHPYRMATVYMSAHSKFTWLKTSKVRWNFSQPLSGVGGEREKNMNAGASKSNIIYSRYGSSVYFMAKRYR